MFPFERLTPESVRRDPFPHVVLDDALPASRYALLSEAFPLAAVLATGDALANNARLSLPAAAGDLTPAWAEFVAECTSQALLDRVREVFGPWLGPDDARLSRAGVRGRASFATADVLLDAQVCVNTAVERRPSSVRGGHLDDPRKLFTGLLYFRAPEDTSTGGDLQLCRLAAGARFRTHEVAERHVEAAVTVRYAPNVLVLFLNGAGSAHRVTARSVTPFERRFVNLLGEVERPRFDLEARQEFGQRLLRPLRATLDRLSGRAR